MKPTGMPAYNLTADCIWNSFQSSGKRHLVLTGTRGSGKTTLLQQLFPEKLPGITSWAMAKNAVFLQDNLTGSTRQVGIFDASRSGTENKMVPLGNAFANFGLSLLRQAQIHPSPWVTIDEIGYLEANSPAYLQGILALLETKQVAMVVRKQPLPFLQNLCRREDVFLVDLDNPFGSIGCVIMASGLGKRFGGNKLMADFAGTPLICRALAATQGIFAHRVVVTRHQDVAQLCQSQEIPFVLHGLPHRSDTVRLGLAAMPEVQGCMFLPGDQPLLRQDTIAALALAAANCPHGIWRTRFEDTPGSPVLFPRWTFPELLALPEGKGGGFVIKKHPEQLHTITVRDKYELMDVDRPEDLAMLAER